MPFSASETHSLKNVRRTHAQMLEEVREVAELIRTRPSHRRPRLEGSISTAFGCTYEGMIPADTVVKIAESLMSAGCDQVDLADSVGYANPGQVRQLAKRVQSAIGASALSGLHLHNTRGLGLANVLAGLDAGIRTFDSSLGGLGGCPFAPGATGNIVTEDLAFMLDSMGMDCGVNVEELLAVRTILQSALPEDQLYGFTPAAGLPKGYPGRRRRMVDPNAALPALTTSEER